MNEFVTAILEERKPLVDVAWALNMTVSGVVAHQSVLKDGESNVRENDPFLRRGGTI